MSLCPFLFIFLNLLKAEYWKISSRSAISKAQNKASEGKITYAGDICYTNWS